MQARPHRADGAPERGGGVHIGHFLQVAQGDGLA